MRRSSENTIIVTLSSRYRCVVSAAMWSNTKTRDEGYPSFCVSMLEEGRGISLILGTVQYSTSPRDEQSHILLIDWKVGELSLCRGCQMSIFKVFYRVHGSVTVDKVLLRKRQMPTVVSF